MNDLAYSCRVATIEDLLACIDDPEDDSTRAYELVAQLTEPRDRSLIPRLVDELRSFIAAEHFYGRDVIADAIAPGDPGTRSKTFSQEMFRCGGQGCRGSESSLLLAFCE